MKRIFLCIATGLFLISAARADEFHLKDGTTITGTLVAYEKNIYRVKTAYGYAEIERSSVVSITITNPKPGEKKSEKAAKAKPEQPVNPSGIAKDKTPDNAALEKEAATDQKIEPEKNTAAKSTPLTASRVSLPSENATAPVKPPASSAATSTPTSHAANTATAPNANSTPTPIAPATQPVAAPEPAPVKEEVRGNQYINDTYGFQMYKPPDWDVIAGARAALPGSIVAMGTSDQTTYLIIGLVPASGTVQEQIAATNERLASSFEGYEPEKTRDATIAGLPAHEYEFHGAANDKEWTGTVALVQRGGNILTILGVTSTNTDLVQMEQNVIARTIASLQFTTP